MSAIAPQPTAPATAHPDADPDANPDLDAVVCCPAGHDLHGHDTLTKASLAASLARLFGLPYAGFAQLAAGLGAGHYLVPCETLTRPQATLLGLPAGAQALDRLFGGVVPHAFVASKVITHPLAAADGDRPAGWMPAFADSVAPVVLPGWSAFDADAARRGCARLLHDGAVRVKNAAGVGGGGQAVVRDLDQFDALLDSQAFAPPWPLGLVLERNLQHVRTVSIGQVRVRGLQVSYYGRQRGTRDRHGDTVYGGSSLYLVRGDFDALMQRMLPRSLRLAARQALDYHRSAQQCFDGFVVSRANYDIAQGWDDAGTWRSGVLEQSWRIGGASGAEVAALHAFQARPDLRWVQASTVECHADGARPPPGAEVHFHGEDPQLGPLLKYSLLHAHGDH